MINFGCSHCPQQLRVADDLAGKSAKCPGCGNVTPIPSDSSKGQSAIAATATLPPAAPGDEQPTLPPPETQPSFAAMPARVNIPGYEILDELGRGGMGVIYKARQLQPRRLVALKMILSGEHAGAEQMARFRNEAEAVARLQHPNIVQIFNVGEHNGLPYLTLEFINGGNLAELLRKQKLKPQHAAELLIPVAEAVHYAHQRGIIHRDLKPANILIGSRGEGLGIRKEGQNSVRGEPSISAADAIPAPYSLLPDSSLKITDFGLAKQLENMASVAPAGPQTQSGVIMGTPQYMAPEQVAGKREAIGPAVDVYALGALLYEMLAGRPPFQANTTLDVLMKVATEEPPSLRLANAGVPRDLETICLKCLDKDPRRRYGSAQELADDLRRFVAGEPIKARPYGRMERFGRWLRKRNAAVLAAVGMGLLALLGMCCLLPVLGMLSWFGVERHPDGVNPNDEPIMVAERPKVRRKQVKLPADLDMIPRDVHGFVAVRVGELWQRSDLQMTAESIPLKVNEGLPAILALLDEIEKQTGIKPKDVDRATVVFPDSVQPLPFINDATGFAAIVSLSRPYDKISLAKFLMSKKIGLSLERVYNGKTTYQMMINTRGLAVCFVSDRILLISSAIGVQAFLDRSAKSGDSGPLRPALELAMNKSVVAAAVPATVDMMEFRETLRRKKLEDRFDPKTIVISLQLAPENPRITETKMTAELNWGFANPAAAHDGESAARIVMSEMLNELDKSTQSKKPNNRPADLPEVVNRLVNPLRAQFWRRDRENVSLTINYSWKPAEVPTLVDNWMEFVARTNSGNNLKQLGLAMHEYHSSMRSFPRQATTDKTGKPLLSWRVAILPYIEQKNLYKQFHLDEAWDSPHNKNLIARMPPVFAHPLDTAGAKKGLTYYQVFVGEKSNKLRPIFAEGAAPTQISQIKDGAAQTILIVESAKPVYWTQPEDIMYMPNQPVAKLGLFKSGFQAVFADGGLKFLPRSLLPNEANLHQMITCNDNIPIRMPD